MNWISVKEKLPEERQRVIIFGCAQCYTCNPKPIAREGRYSFEEGFVFGEYDCSCDVTHWMPMPEDPKD